MTPAPTLIITRPEPDASRLAAIARARGLHPVMSPTLVITFDEKRLALTGYGALAFTSANGVRAFVRASEDRSLRAFAIGRATAAAAREAGFHDVVVADGDLDSLVATISADATEKPIVHIAGRDRAGDLVERLRLCGVACDRRVLYRAEAVEDLSEDARDAIDAARGDVWVALFSPRTSQMFMAQLARAERMDRAARIGVACLSEAVAEPLRDAGFQPIAIAKDASAEALLDLLRA